MTNNINSVLFVIPEQYGYSAGYTYYCKYLTKFGYKVGVICLDTGGPKKKLYFNEMVYYVNSNNAIGYRLAILKTILKVKNNYNIIILKYFPGVSTFLLVLLGKRIWLDIRTGSVRRKKLYRRIENLLIKMESFFFRRIFILSLSLAKQLLISSKRTILLPLGAEEMSVNIKTYTDSMRLLYIGTLFGRNLHECIEGFAKYYYENKDKLNLHFDIIGDGPDFDKKKVLDAIDKNQLNKVVKYHGHLLHEEAAHFFDKCNVGVSYIPMTEFYENQPPTKTFEYVLSGLVCVATNTSANKELIHKTNGVLHDDNPESFYKALNVVCQNRHLYDYKIIKSSLHKYHWEQIVQNIMIKEFNVNK